MFDTLTGVVHQHAMDAVHHHSSSSLDEEKHDEVSDHVVVLGGLVAQASCCLVKGLVRKGLSDLTSRMLVDMPLEEEEPSKEPFVVDEVFGDLQDEVQTEGGKGNAQGRTREEEKVDPQECVS